MKTLSKVLTTGAVAAAALSFGGVAQAALLNANAGLGQGFNPGTAYTGPNLANATSITFGAPLQFTSTPPSYLGNPNDFAPGGGAQINSPTYTITPNTLNLVTPGLPIPNFITFSTIAGAGSFDLTSIELLTTPGNNNVLNIKTLGTINVPGFNPSPGSALFNFNQVGGSGAVSFSGTLASPPEATPVPEPSTLLGILAVAGVGALTRRKS